MSDGGNGFVDAEHTREPEGTANPSALKRIYPVDDYTIPDEILRYTTRHHFLRVPLIGQHNPVADKGDWCGRTSAVMVWNYYQRVFGNIKSKTDYITHWRGSKGTDRMDFRHPKTEEIVAMLGGRYYPGGLLNTISGVVSVPGLFELASIEKSTRLQEADRIASSLEEQQKVLAPILTALESNNPAVVFTGLSTSKFGGHIIVIAGYGILRDQDGAQKLWLLIADPASPKTNAGPTLTPLHIDPRVALEHLGELDEKKHAMIPIVQGDWAWGRAHLYLMRARKFFERNTNKADAQAIWLDDMGNGYRGGRHLLRVEKTPFVPGLVLSKGIRSGLSFPFQRDENVLDSVARGFYEVEHAENGFFPLGTNRSLHGGVHWPPPAGAGEAALVRSMAPGYIVAARISRAPCACGTKQFLNHDNGFVLVRHEFLKLDRKGKEQGDRRPFYALYMHMAPTAWPENIDAYKDVPWLVQFYLARHAAIVNLDPKAGRLGAILFAAKKTDPDAMEATEVYASHNAGAKTQPKVLRQKTRALGYVKEAQGDLVQGFEALKQGAVATFSAPLLPVRHGEALGAIKSAKTEDTHGALHWEVFAPAKSNSAVEEILDYASSTLGLEVADVAEAGADKKDNLIDDEEAKSLFSSSLPEEDKAIAEGVFAAAKADRPQLAMGNYLRDFFRARASFFVKADKEPAYLEPTFVDAKEGEVESHVQCYPLKLAIDTKSYPVRDTSANPMPYTIEVRYFASGAKAPFASAKKELAESDFKKDPLELNLLVPARAEMMKIITPQFHLDVCDAENIKLQPTFASRLLGARWRGLFLQHVSEWSPGGMSDLIPKLRKQALLPQALAELTDDEAIARVLAASWYGVPKAEDLAKVDLEKPEEAPIVGAKGEEVSLFDGDKAMLPAKDIAGHKGTAEVLDAHPVSFLWLLNHAFKTESYRLIEDYVAPSADTGTDHDPVMWGFVLDDEAPLVAGQDVSAMAIERGWGFGTLVLVLTNQDSKAALQTFAFASGNYQDGVFVASRELPLWGEYVLGIEGHKGEVEKQGGAALAATVRLMRPLIAETFVPQKDDKTGLYAIDLHFAAGSPASLGGYLTFEHAKFALPEGVLQASSWIVDAMTGSYVIGLKAGATRVTKSFDLAAYLGAEGAEGRIAVALCVAIEAFFVAAKSIGLRVLSVGDQGREVVLEPWRLPPQSGKARESVAAALAKAAGEAKGGDVSFAVEEAENKQGKKTFRIKATLGKAPPELSWKKLDECLPVAGRALAPTEGPVEIERGYIRRIRKQKVTPKNVQLQPHFWFSEFQSVFGASDIKLHTQLVARLEALWVAHNKESQHGNMIVQALDPSGLVVAVTCAFCEQAKGAKRDEARNKLEACAKSLEVKIDGESKAAFALVCTESLSRRWPKKADALALVLGIDEPERDTSGVVQYCFDPKEAFTAVLAASRPGKNERTFIRAGFGAFNGDVVEECEGPPSTLAKIPSELDRQDSLHARVADVFKTLAKPTICPIQTALRSSNIVLSAYLLGAKQDWAAAAPTFFVGETAIGKSPPSTAPEGAVCTAELPLVGKDGAATAYVGKAALEIELKTTNADAMFDGERIAVEGVEMAIDTTPKLKGPLTVERLGDGNLRLRAEVHCCDAASLKVTCSALDAEGVAVAAKSVWPKAKGALVEHYIYKQAITYESLGLSGVYEALLSLAHLERGKTYRFTLMPKARDEIFGVKVADKPTCDFAYEAE